MPKLAIGFGSLCFASNDALAGKGMVAVTGILLCMLLSLFLLPVLAGSLNHEEQGGRVRVEP